MRRRLLAGAALLLAGNAAFTAWASGAAGPRIGVVVSDAWFDVAGFNPAAYELAIVRAGGAAVRIRPEDSLDGLSGLVLIGGGDVDPAEFALLREAERRNLPVLAICRGAQALATAYGGALGPAGRRHGVSIRSLWAHDVRCEPGTRAGGVFGSEAFRASSTHATAIADAGPRLRVSASSDDGGIEAVELPGERFVLGLQWHPEWEGREEPFVALVDAARP
ncbi:MAG TPA: gamma-glutamyl-gamma-aminobutyrate hydrolase family protein [Planctomycetota bacterium]